MNDVCFELAFWEDFFVDFDCAETLGYFEGFEEYVKRGIWLDLVFDAVEFDGNHARNGL